MLKLSWDEAAGVVLAALYPILKVELPGIPDQVLEHAIQYMPNPSMLAASVGKKQVRLQLHDMLQRQASAASVARVSQLL